MRLLNRTVGNRFTDGIGVVLILVGLCNFATIGMSWWPDLCHEEKKNIMREMRKREPETEKTFWLRQTIAKSDRDHAGDEGGESSAESETLRLQDTSTVQWIKFLIQRCGWVCTTFRQNQTVT